MDGHEGWSGLIWILNWMLPSVIGPEAAVEGGGDISERCGRFLKSQIDIFDIDWWKTRSENRNREKEKEKNRVSTTVAPSSQRISLIHLLICFLASFFGCICLFICLFVCLFWSGFEILIDWFVSEPWGWKQIGTSSFLCLVCLFCFF